MVNLDNDVKLKLLAGKPIMMANGVNVYPITLSEMTDMGETDYLKRLSILTMSDEDCRNLFKMNDLSTFQSLYVN